MALLTVVALAAETFSADPMLVEEGHTGLVTGVALAPDRSQLASCAYDGEAIIWELPGQRIVKRLKVDDNPLSCVTYFPSGTSLCIGVANQVKIYDTESWEVRRTLATDWHAASAKSVHVSDVAFSPDGKSVALGLFDSKAGVGSLEIWQGGKTFYLGDEDDRVYECLGVFFVDDKTVWTVFNSGVLQKWDLESRKLETRISVPEPRVGRQVVQLKAADYCLKSYALILASAMHRLTVISASDGEQIAAFEDASITKEDGAEVCRFLSINDDGKWAVTGGGSSKCNVWNLESKKLHSTFPAETSFHDGLFVTNASVAVLAKEFFLLQEVP